LPLIAGASATAMQSLLPKPAGLFAGKLLPHSKTINIL
jgi:hypothetical protein